MEEPREAAFGDLCTPICLKLARTLRANPLGLAEKLAAALRENPLEFVAEITVTAPGYINFIFDYAKLAQMVILQWQGSEVSHGGKMPPLQFGSNKKVVIEHTNINPNKAAHIGHLRNACLGDTLARLLRSTGYEVEVQNYIDDTGTAVADIVVGLELLGWQEDERSYDYFCWDLYTAINEIYEKEPARKARQGEVLHLIEAGGNAVATRAKDISLRIVQCHLKTMARLGIYYDLLTWESHILHQGFWKQALANLQGKSALVYEEEGANAGCWVVRLTDHPEFAGLENPDKVLVRSNGTATYVAKDIAYQMWKFGVLGKDFGYERYMLQANGAELWTTAGGEELRVESEELRVFGNADRVINVIDIRQKYLQDVLRVSLEQLGFADEAANSVHYDYEVVALSGDAAQELGVGAEESAGVIAMAGRKGIGVKADDLIGRVEQKATEEVQKRHPELSREQTEQMGAEIATAAIRYYMQRYNISSLIVFDFAEALNMQGNSGPYLQYAYARANNILEKCRGDRPRSPERDGERNAEHNTNINTELNDSEKRLTKRIAELPGVLKRASESLSAAQLCEYAYQLSAAFMAFYENSPVMKAEAAVAEFRLQLVTAFKHSLGYVLNILGIPAMKRM